MKTKEEIMERLKENYKTVEDMGYEIVGIFLQGSQNYNLQYEDSDIDCKAIILPNFEDFVLCNKTVSTTFVLENWEHIDLKDIRVIFENFKKQNINFVEVLFTEYKIINPKYEKLFQPMFDNNEKIAHYNNYASLSCISGMSLEKYKALEHPYPATIHKIEKWGWDGKQLHHILRLNEFIKRYIKNEKYSECLLTKDRECLIEIKKNSGTLEEARFLAKSTCDDTRITVKEYMENNQLVINKEVDDIMKNVLMNVMRYNFQTELFNNVIN